METAVQNEPVGLGALRPEHHEELARAGLSAVPVGFGLAPEHREELARAGLTVVPRSRVAPRGFGQVISTWGNHPMVTPQNTINLLSQLGLSPYIAAPGSSFCGSAGSSPIVAQLAQTNFAEVQVPNGLPLTTLAQILAAFIADSGGIQQANTGSGTAPLAHQVRFSYNGIPYSVGWNSGPSGTWPLIRTCPPGSYQPTTTTAAATTTDYTWLYVLLGVAAVGGVLYVALD
jgi:hypothetical protein